MIHNFLRHAAHGAIVLGIAAALAFPAAAQDKVSPASPAPNAAPKAATATATPGPAAKKDYVILTVGNGKVMASEVDDTWKAIFPGGGAPDFSTLSPRLRASVLQEVINKRLVHEAALREGLDKRDDVQKRLALAQRQVLVQAYVEDKTKNTLSPERLKQAYDKLVATYKDKEEVHARHILVKTEEEAKAIRKQLKEGGNFAALAKEKSIDKGSAEEGGDLGFFTEDRLVPPFTKAAFSLKKGDISEPVKTSFGWHVIEVLDRRKAQPPSFAEAEDKLKEQVLNERVSAMLDELRAGSPVKYFDESGKEQPLPSKDK